MVAELALKCDPNLKIHIMCFGAFDRFVTGAINEMRSNAKIRNVRSLARRSTFPEDRSALCANWLICALIVTELDAAVITVLKVFHSID